MSALVDTASLRADVARLTKERDAELAARVDAQCEVADYAVRLCKALRNVAVLEARLARYESAAGDAAHAAVHGDPLRGSIGTINPKCGWQLTEGEDGQCVLSRGHDGACTLRSQQ